MVHPHHYRKTKEKKTRLSLLGRAGKWDLQAHCWKQPDSFGPVSKRVLSTVASWASGFLWQYLGELVGRGWGLFRAVCPCRSRDFYHTCYCLSGLSIAQHFGSGAMLHDVVMGVPENALVRQAGVQCPSSTSSSGSGGLISEEPLVS